MKTAAINRVIYWLNVSVIGVVLGFSIQFVQAWVEPPTNPPNANLGAPLNTGTALQTKAGSLSINATGNPIGMVVQGAVGIGTTSPGARLHVENGGDYLRYTGTDLLLSGAGSGRGTGGRALVADGSETLTINYAGDFGGGVNVGSVLRVPELCLNGDCRKVWPSGGTGSGITGSGTTGKLPKWTGSTALGDSIVTEASGVINIAGGLGVNGAFNVNIGSSYFKYTGTDVLLSGAGAGRGAGGRALVADGSETLTINYGGDFGGGVSVHSILKANELYSYGKISSEGQVYSKGDIRTEGTLYGKYLGGIEGDIRSNATISARNNVCLDSGVCLAALSDIRLKKNIEPITEAVDKLSQIKGVTYDWIDPKRGTGQQVGVISQDIEKVLPQLVHPDENGYKTVDYSKLTALLIEAAKEQEKKIDEQQMQIDELKAILETLKNE